MKFIIVFILFMFLSNCNNDIAYASIPDIRVPWDTYDLMQINALAKNAFFEARNQERIGWKAVMAVTLTRARETNRSIKQVVYRPRQFSWTHGMSESSQRYWIRRDNKTWREIYRLAEKLYRKPHYRETSIGRRDHFLNRELTLNVYGRLPRWYVEGKGHKRIGEHVFLYA